MRWDVFAWVLGEPRQQNTLSTIAYLARPMFQCCAQPGLLDEHGRPIEAMDLLHFEADNVVPLRTATAGAMDVRSGQQRHAYGNLAVIRKNSSNFRAARGAIRTCI